MNLADIRTNAALLLKADTLRELCSLLEVSGSVLMRLREGRLYNEFYVRKQSGGKRLIEDPYPPLKALQETLNDYFQSVYYLHRSRSVYGFQLVLSHERHPRNIKTNALQHLGKSWMLNADFQDFFHQVSTERLVGLFTKQRPFRFPVELAQLLADLCTYKGRLPMGAPTSPVLSNLVSLELDRDYLEFADLHNFVYTRFADDLTFSSFDRITPEHQRTVVQIAGLHGLAFNEKKFKLMGPTHTKIVTGLKVADKVELTDDYLADLEAELTKYAHAVEITTRSGLTGAETLKKHEQVLEGHLEFVEFVVGKRDAVYQKLEKQYKEAKNTSRFDLVSWLDFDYLYFKGKKRK